MPIDCTEIPHGTILAGYRIETELGRGNNAVVYLAEQQSLGRKVALKILFPELAAEPGYIESFLREARLAARLDHLYIVQAYDAGATPEGYYYFAMELVIGPSLEEIRRETPEQLTFELIFRMAVELAEALDYAWTIHKMTHGDIKPGNMLISAETGILKLADLGLARVSGGKSSEDIMATPLYAAPEVIRGEGPDGVRSDLYSFGIMLYELLCGSPPFVGNPQKVLDQHLYNAPQPLLERNPDLDPQLVAFIERLIDKDARKRPESWLEVRAFFANRLLRLQNPQKESYAVEPSEQRLKRKLKGALAILVILVILAALAMAVLLALRVSRFDAEPLHAQPEQLPRVLPVPKAQEPELAVRFSSPMAKVETPEEPESGPEPEPEPEPKPIIRAIASEASPPTEKSTLPVTPPPPVDPPQPPPQSITIQQPDPNTYNPPVNRTEWNRRTRQTYQLLSPFQQRLSDEWKQDAAIAIRESQRLLMQLEEKGVASKSVDRIDLLPSGHGGSNWVSDNPQSGSLRIAGDVSAFRIAQELGMGCFEANRDKYKLPRNLAKEFAEAFRYFVEERAGRNPQEIPDNRILQHCRHNIRHFSNFFLPSSLRRLQSRR